MVNIMTFLALVSHVLQLNKEYLQQLEGYTSRPRQGRKINITETVLKKLIGYIIIKVDQHLDKDQ